MLPRGRLLGAVGVSVGLRAQHQLFHVQLPKLVSPHVSIMLSDKKVNDDTSLEEQERMAAELAYDSEGDDSGEADALFGDKGLPSVESSRFLQTGKDIRVCSSEGTRTMSRTQALVNLPAAEVYAILANPDNSKLIRSINKVNKHKVVSDGADVKAARAQHDISGGPKLARLEFSLDINFTFFPQSNSGEFELDTPCGMRIYKGQFKARDVKASGNKVLAIDQSDNGKAMPDMDVTDKSALDTLPALERPSGQCLLWVQQEIEPDVPQKLPPRTVRGVLRRSSRKEMHNFIEDIQIVAQLRNAGVPMKEILTSKIRGRGGLIRKTEGQQKKESKKLRKLEQQERKHQRKSGKSEPEAPVPPHLAGAAAGNSSFRTYAIEV